MNEKLDTAFDLMHKIKKSMSFVVLVIMTIIVGISIVELAILLYLDIFDPADDVIFLEINELFRIFGFFFIILIGFELLETIEMYFKHNVVHAEVVLLVAVIAVSRKVILLDLEKYDPVSIIGLGLIILALGGCYFLIKLSFKGKDA